MSPTSSPHASPCRPNRPCRAAIRRCFLSRTPSSGMTTYESRLSWPWPPPLVSGVPRHGPRRVIEIDVECSQRNRVLCITTSSSPSPAPSPSLSPSSSPTFDHEGRAPWAVICNWRWQAGNRNAVTERMARRPDSHLVYRLQSSASVPWRCGPSGVRLSLRCVRSMPMTSPSTPVSGVGLRRPHTTFGVRFPFHFIHVESSPGSAWGYRPDPPCVYMW